jgi:hypothetical protein
MNARRDRDRLEIRVRHDECSPASAMSIHRTVLALFVVPLTLGAGLFACGGKVAADDERDAAATPSTGGTSAPTGAPTPTPTPTATATGTPSVSPTSLTLRTDACGSRPEMCSGLGGGVADGIVQRWIAKLVDACEHPTTGVPPAFPACSEVHVKFARTLDGGGCAGTVTFSMAQPMSFAACMATALSNQRCVAGLFLSGDEGTYALCPPR